MGKKFLMMATGLLCAALMHGQSVFINELHYDDSNSPDTLEGVEIAGPAGTDLDCYKIVFYNGAGGTVYSTMNLSGTIPDQCNGMGAVWFLSPSLIQNGAPDGLALVFDPALPGCSTPGVLNVIQFLSYEGAFTAVGGDANGMLSTDIGVFEPNATLPTNSLQLSGAGSVYTDFSWQSPAPATRGTLNNGQTFGVGPCAAIIPTQFIYSGLPAGCLATGSPFTLTLCAANGSGTVDASFNGPVTLSLNNGTPPINGTTTVNAVNGCATFSNLSLSAIDTFSFTGTGGLISTNSSTIYTSPACTTCPNMEGAFIDACGSSEGNNEILIFNTGNFFIPTNSASISLNYGASFPPSTNYTGSMITNQIYVDSLNNRAGCSPALFLDAVANSPIPPNSTFMMMRFDPTNVYDFTAWCGQGPIYMLFITDPDWNSTGNFKNCLDCDSLTANGYLPRYFQADFSTLTNGAACDFSYQYVPCSDLTCLGNGDGLSWNYGGGSPSLSWNECTPNSLLPVSYASELHGNWADENTARLSWATGNENKSSHFVVERAIANREGFKQVGQVSAAGHSDNVQEYAFSEHPPLGRDLLYRLKSVDLDGKSSHSNVIRLHSAAPSHTLQVIVDPFTETATLPNTSGVDQVLVFDTQGRVVFASRAKSPEDVRISLSGLVAGVYFVRVQDAQSVRSAKFLFQR